MPLNPLTVKFFEMETNPSQILIEELTKIMLTRYRNCNLKFYYKWGTWIPTTNTTIIQISKKFLEEIKIPIINPNCFCEYFPNTSIKDDKRKLQINKKYKAKKIEKNLIKKIKGTNGIILDDLYHRGHTMARIMEILSNYGIQRILGIVLARTIGKKGITINYFPK